MALLTVEGLTKNYLAKKALPGVDLKLEQGVILGLLGPNGSGKSTLLKAVIGFVKPDGGRVTIKGLAPGQKTKALVAYLPEEDHLYQWMRVGELAVFTGKFFSDWDSQRYEELLGFLGLDTHAKISSLSKGMRARVKLLLALSRRAPLLLLDEPFSGIDLISRERIISALIEFHQDQEQAIIISTHEVHECEPIFDQVLFLEEGEVRLAGNAEEIRAQRGMSIVELYREVYQ